MLLFSLQLPLKKYKPMGLFPRDWLERKKACVWFEENKTKTNYCSFGYSSQTWLWLISSFSWRSKLCHTLPCRSQEGREHKLFLLTENIRRSLTERDCERLHLHGGRESDPLCWSRDHCRRLHHWWTCRWSSRPPGPAPGPTWCTWTSPRPCWCGCAPFYQPRSSVFPLSSSPGTQTVSLKNSNNITFQFTRPNTHF